MKGIDTMCLECNYESFPDEVSEKLKTYVYRLIDPRNGETFYVGKGQGNRVFSHAHGDIEGDSASEKISRIRNIKLSGFKVGHVIHRHSMDDATAFEVEAALIDAYPGLTNIVDGHGGDYGAMHAEEIIKRYSAEPAVFQHKAMLINVNRSAIESSVYEATRFAWRVNKQQAEKADFVCAVHQGIIVGVFVVDEWLEANSNNFPGREDMPGRYGYNGREAPFEIKQLYIGKRIPDKFRRKGAANPIKYSWS